MDKTIPPGLNRRTFMGAGGAAVVGGALLANPRLTHAQAPYAAGTPSSAQVRTAAGAIRGLYNGRAHVFRGIPYGAPTSGVRRFMPPAKPIAWSGVLDATELGQQSPQLTMNIMAEELVSLDNSAQGEDCLRLNVWTAGLDDAKRPVMVWFHGGGFSGGSGGNIRYDGTNLASRHDVVVVTVNERLNAFGFLYLAELGGEKYADSGNAGLLDLVASLEWVHENIRHFGGDPDNVTIFGQSGGGGKTTTLMATPRARGLFHRAIAESGFNIEGVSTKQATAMATAIMDRLGLQPHDVDQLQQLPAERILAALSALSSSEGGFLNFGPVVDNRTLLGHPWEPEAPLMSRDVPLLMGSTLTEVVFFPATPRDPIDDGQLHDLVQHRLGFGAPLHASPQDADQLVSVYRRGHPRVDNMRLFQIMASDNLAVTMAMLAERKARLGGAAAYLYHFEWITPVEGGRLGAPHTLEIPFVFDNMDVPTVDIITGTGEERYELADKMSRTWVAFARTGKPAVSGLPEWMPYSADRRAVMIIDREWRLVNNPYAEQYAALAQLMSRGA